MASNCDLAIRKVVRFPTNMSLNFPPQKIFGASVALGSFANIPAGQQRGWNMNCKISGITEWPLTATPVPECGFRLHVELHQNLCFNLDRFTTQQIGSVLPLFYGIHGSLRQNWLPTHNAQVFDVALFTDCSCQHHVALNVRDLRHLRILWLNPGLQLTFSHAR